MVMHGTFYILEIQLSGRAWCMPPPPPPHAAVKLDRKLGPAVRHNPLSIRKHSQDTTP
jgi:hypothetical protein